MPEVGGVDQVGATISLLSRQNRKLWALIPLGCNPGFAVYQVYDSGHVPKPPCITVVLYYAAGKRRGGTVCQQVPGPAPGIS